MKEHFKVAFLYLVIFEARNTGDVLHLFVQHYKMNLLVLGKYFEWQYLPNILPTKVELIHFKGEEAYCRIQLFVYNLMCSEFG